MKIAPLSTKIDWLTILFAKRCNVAKCVGANTLRKAMTQSGLSATYGEPIIQWGDRTGYMFFADRTFHVYTSIEVSMLNVWWPRRVIFTFKDVTDF